MASFFSTSTLKNFLRQIPLRRIRNHRHHSLARSQPPSPTCERRKCRRPPARPRQHAFFAANVFTMPNASSSVTMITSSHTDRSKVFGMKLAPIPSTLCGPGGPPPRIDPWVSTAYAEHPAYLLLQISRHAGKSPRSPAAEHNCIHAPIHLLEEFREPSSHSDTRDWPCSQTARP